MPGTLLSLTTGWAYALAQLAVLSTHPAELLAATAVAATAVLLAAALADRWSRRPSGATDRVGPGATLRQRARRTRVPRQLDPDAAGRPRPRAPSPRPSAA